MSFRLIIYLTVFILVNFWGIKPNLYGQVHIAPVAVYLSENNTSGQITVYNSSDLPQELNIELLYGYPDTDDKGNVFLNTFEQIPKGAPSAVEFARIYPRQLILPPGEQQIIRFSVRPPSNLKPGEYWARPAVTSIPVTQNEKNSVRGISTKFNVINRTILSLNYRHGRVNTGIEVEDFKITANEEEIFILTANLLRQGNAAYIGHAIITVSQDGKEIHTQKQEVAVYNNQFRRFKINKNFASGDYKVTLTLSTREREEEIKGILPAKIVSKSATITLR